MHITMLLQHNTKKLGTDILSQAQISFPALSRLSLPLPFPRVAPRPFELPRASIKTDETVLYHPMQCTQPLNLVTIYSELIKGGPSNAVAKSTSKISQSAQRFIGGWSAEFPIAFAAREVCCRRETGDMGVG